jgi:hypothetical protein
MYLLSGQNFPVNLNFSRVHWNYIYKNSYSLCGGRYFVNLTKHHFLTKHHRKFSRWARFVRLVPTFPTTRAKLPGIASQFTPPYFIIFCFEFWARNTELLFNYYRRWCLLTKTKHQGWLGHIQVRILLCFIYK